jgi:hypothetical protein
VDITFILGGQAKSIIRVHNLFRIGTTVVQNHQWSVPTAVHYAGTSQRTKFLYTENLKRTQQLLIYDGGAIVISLNTGRDPKSTAAPHAPVKCNVGQLRCHTSLTALLNVVGSVSHTDTSHGGYVDKPHRAETPPSAV